LLAVLVQLQMILEEEGLVVLEQHLESLLLLDRLLQLLLAQAGLVHLIALYQEQTEVTLFLAVLLLLAVEVVVLGLLLV
jgi:hypothetical protein